MSRQIRHFYDFDHFRLDATERALFCDGEMMTLTQKALDVLLVLVEQRGRIVEKDELMKRVWPDTFVEESNLAHQIYTLRKALGKASDEKEYIRTIPRRGYRFIAEVSETRDEIGEADYSLSVEESVAADARASVNARGVEPGPRPDASSIGNSLIKLRAIVTALACLLLVTAAGAAIWWIKAKPFKSHSNGSSSGMTITNLTTTGNLSCVAVSPDGRNVAYGLAEGPQRSSLWLMQLGAFTSRPIIPPAEVQYRALTFSPDGHYIYYVLLENALSRRTLHRVSLLGGPSKKLLEGVNSPISFSPDGAQFVFERLYEDRRKSALIVANVDGSGEKEVAAIRYPERFLNPVWSPDGKVIACTAGHDQEGLNMYAVAAPVGDWKVTRLLKQNWRWVGQMGWLADSSGLVMVASERLTTPFQIWRLAYPSGETQKVTNDSNFYERLSVSADSSTLVAMDRRLTTNVWLIPREEPDRARQITFGAGGYRGRISWLRDGRIVYDSEAGAAASISIMNSDGSHQQQLMGDQTGRAYVGWAMASPDGRYIVYSSDLTGVRRIWRMNPDGSNPVQLTNGEGESHPYCSPDGRWVVYTKLERKGIDRPTLWRVSIDGGESTQLTDEFTAYPSVSPDGKMIACFYSEAHSPWKLAVYPFDGGAPIKTFPVPIPDTSSMIVRWTPDGQALTYAENPIGASKIWIQPLAGGPPKLLAEFGTDRIFGFGWSPDGKHLACVRGNWAFNAVMIKDFK